MTLQLLYALPKVHNINKMHFLLCKIHYFCTNKDAMFELLEQSELFVSKVPADFKRYLYNRINWKNRLIGIKGARGTGKTTLILQRLKQLSLRADKAAYLSLDDMY
ncbi:MAG: hypothetical protein K9J27_11100, partial [Bacteroidales bacterium]|nr:hypothetical protein [Bacteroidales bacterium]